MERDLEDRLEDDENDSGSDVEVEEEVEENEYDEEDVEALRVSLESKPDYRKYWVLTPEQVAEQMGTLVTQTSVAGQIPANLCRAFLYKYKWNSLDLLKDYGDLDPVKFYEKNNLVALGEAIGSLDLSKLMQEVEEEDEGKLVECPICFCEVPVGETAQEVCGHVICLGCWRDHIQLKVEKEGCGIIILCPACPFIISDQIIRELLPNTETLKKLMANQVSTFVDSHPMMTWCPGEKCSGTIIRVESLKWSPGPVICTKCKLEFCISCKKTWHAPLCCDFVDLWEKEVKSTDKTTDWIRGNSKPCPKCGVPIEKNGGCNYMTCSNKACGYHFCWICLGKAHAHNFAETCSKVNPESLEKIKKERKDTQESLQHFVFHSERYLSHMRSLEFEVNLDIKTKKILEDAVLKYGTRIINVDQVGIAEAVKTLKRCRRMLAYGYAFMFYLPTDAQGIAKNEKLVYQQNLNNLHAQTERLSFHLEQDLASVLRAPKSTPQDFEKSRAGVIRMAQYCDSRRLKIVSHVLQNHDKGFWNLAEINAAEAEDEPKMETKQN